MHMVDVRVARGRARACAHAQPALAVDFLMRLAEHMSRDYINASLCN
jgi:hypothetical protein